MHTNRVVFGYIKYTNLSVAHHVSKGPSINVSIFMSVQTIHFWVCENQHFFGLIFIISMGNFGTQKMLMCTLFGGEGVSESVWFVHL